MKSYFEEPLLKLVLFEVKDILTVSGETPETGEDELPFIPVNPPVNP